MLFTTVWAKLKCLCPHEARQPSSHDEKAAILHFLTAYTALIYPLTNSFRYVVTFKFRTDVQLCASGITPCQMGTLHVLCTKPYAFNLTGILWDIDFLPWLMLPVTQEHAQHTMTDYFFSDFKSICRTLPICSNVELVKAEHQRNSLLTKS